MVHVVTDYTADSYILGFPHLCCFFELTLGSAVHVSLLVSCTTKCIKKTHTQEGMES